MADQAFHDAVARVLATVGSGEVVTYGEIALEAGYPGRSRAVGRFLAEHGSEHCWWRVVNASGRLVPGHEARQAELLRGEGVDVVDQRRVRFPTTHDEPAPERG